MSGVASSDRLITSLPLLDTADLLQELSLGSDANEVSSIRNKGSREHRPIHVPYGAFPASASHIPTPLGSEGRPHMNVGGLLNGGDLSSDSWGYIPSGRPSAGYQDPRFAFARNNNSNAFSHHMNPYNSHEELSYGQSSLGYIDQLYSNQSGIYGLYGNVIDSGHAYGTFGYDSWKHGRGWYPVDDYRKTRSFNYARGGYNEEKTDRLNELCRGPRSNDTKNPQDSQSTMVEGLKHDISELEEHMSSFTLDLQKYNGQNFPETFVNAKFFVIKSYSEDDVHKSIKYGVWSSTPNGNKKLDAAYQETKKNPGNCPMYLLFSVNASGQFVGLAEMVGPVDFNKTMEYWQQDKWIGCFPVKWHIIKDVPNSLLRHITLANNENKPVTNSRDTQEVNLENGTKIVKIFKEHISKTCLLDDFKFYETRQNIIREKKTKQKKQGFDIAAGRMAHLC